MGLDWENFPDDGMVKIIGKIWPGRIVLGPREIWVIFPTGIVSLRVRIMLSRQHSCVPAVLAESEKQDTLKKYGSMPDSMNNPDCELVVG